MVPENYSALVVGCGSIGSRHIRNLDRIGVDQIVAVDEREDRVDCVVEDYDAIPADSLDAGLEHDPDFAVICVPNVSHVPVAQQAADHGCHLFVEKPLSNDMEGVPALRETVQEHDLVSIVGCNLRFHPALRQVRSILNDGRIGKIVSARIEFGSYLPSWHPDQDYRTMYSARADLGGGVILDHIHEIDYARWLFGEVSQVSCFLDKGSDLEIETEDIAAILLRTDTRTIVEIHLDYVQRTYSRGCQIIGTEGTIRWDWGDREVRWTEDGGETPRRNEFPTQWEFNQTYVDEMEHMLACLDGEDTPICDLADGIEALKIALAAKKSNRTGTHVDVRQGLDR